MGLLGKMVLSWIAGILIAILNALIDAGFVLEASPIILALFVPKTLLLIVGGFVIFFIMSFIT